MRPGRSRAASAAVGSWAGPLRASDEMPTAITTRLERGRQ